MYLLSVHVVVVVVVVVVVIFLTMYFVNLVKLFASFLLLPDFNQVTEDFTLYDTQGPTCAIIVL